MIVDVLKTAGRRQTQKLNSTNVILDDLIDGCNDFQRVARKAMDNDERALKQEKKIWGLPRMCILLQIMTEMKSASKVISARMSRN